MGCDFKKSFFVLFSVGLLVLIVGIIGVNAVLTTFIQHTASEIKAKSGSTEITLGGILDSLQYIDNLPTYTSFKTDPGHSFDEIWVFTSKGGRTLSIELETEDICGGGDPTSPTINPYMLATEIEISPGKSLQDSINGEEILLTLNSDVRCDDNDEYNYDSCNTKGSKKTECGESGFEAGTEHCTSGDVYWDFITRGCSVDSCTSITEEMLKEDCGESGYFANYCSDSITLSKNYITRDCSVGSCTGTIEDPEFVEDCSANDGYMGSNYCIGDSVYRDYVTGVCSSIVFRGGCTSTTEPILQQNCGGGDNVCQDGSCIFIGGE